MPSRITPHEVLVLDTLTQDPQAWMTVHQIGVKTGVGERTVNKHLSDFLREGFVERLESFPGYLYRLAPNAEDNEDYCGIRLVGEAIRSASERQGVDTRTGGLGLGSR